MITVQTIAAYRLFGSSRVFAAQLSEHNDLGIIDDGFGDGDGRGDGDGSFNGSGDGCGCEGNSYDGNGCGVGYGNDDLGITGEKKT